MIHPALLDAARTSAPSLKTITIDHALLTLSAQHHVAVGSEAKRVVESGVVCRPLQKRVDIDLKQPGGRELSLGIRRVCHPPLNAPSAC